MDSLDLLKMAEQATDLLCDKIINDALEELEENPETKALIRLLHKYGITGMRAFCFINEMSAIGNYILAKKEAQEDD